MKIAFLTGYLSRHGSGVREVVEHLSRTLAERGHDVRVYGLQNSEWMDGDHTRWTGASPVVAPILGPRALGYAPKWGPDLRHFTPDVVHLHGIWMASAAVAASWSRCTPSGALIVSPHGMLSKVALGYSPGRKRIVRWLYQDRCFASTDLYHATSEIEAGDVTAFGLRAPICVIPNGLDDMPAHVLERALLRDRAVITLGRLHKIKGLERLLRVWARLESRFPDWQLRIVGADAGDGYGAQLKAQAAGLGLQRCFFQGAAFADDKWRALQRSEVFVLASESENFALTVPEALLSGLPVVSTDGAPWAALPKNGCGWYIPRSDDALFEALSEALNLSKDERRAMGDIGRQWVLRTLQWSGVAERFEDAYTAALARKRASI